MQVKPGQKLRSQVGQTQVVVIRSELADVELSCGGHPFIAADQTLGDTVTPDPALTEPTAMGKRYTDRDGRIELLVSKPGIGTLTLSGQPLELKQAKPLPSSD